MNEILLLQEINDNLKKLLAITATQGMSDEKKILTLQKMGLNSTQISEVTGIPIPTIKGKWIKKRKK
jgi:hypothetical protein